MLILMCYGCHAPEERYTATTLPMAAVNEKMGMSPFGLHHMAGNVWQWCRDWYDDQFTPPRKPRDRIRSIAQKPELRSERGGSWVGPAELCRCSHRRGRVPNARGRCLGFRCISECERCPTDPLTRIIHVSPKREFRSCTQYEQKMCKSCR